MNPKNKLTKSERFGDYLKHDRKATDISEQTLWKMYVSNLNASPVGREQGLLKFVGPLFHQEPKEVHKSAFSKKGVHTLLFGNRVG